MAPIAPFCFGRRAAEELWRRAGGARHFAEHSRRRRVFHHRAEWRRQIDAAQPHKRHLPAGCRHHDIRWDRSRRAWPRNGACVTAWRERFRKSACSSSYPSLRTSSPDFTPVTTSRPGNISFTAQPSAATTSAAATRRWSFLTFVGLNSRVAGDRRLAVLWRAAHARNRPRAGDRAAPADGRRAGSGPQRG